MTEESCPFYTLSCPSVLSFWGTGKSTCINTDGHAAQWQAREVDSLARLGTVI